MANRNFKVKHTMVGQYPEGHVVSEEELIRHGYQIDRLLSLTSGTLEDGVTPRPNPALEITNEDPTGEPPKGPHFGYVYGDEEENVAMAEAQNEDAGDGDDGGEGTEDDTGGEDTNGNGVLEYSEMNLTQLKQQAHEKGIEGYSTMKKADLVAALQEHDAAQ